MPSELNLIPTIICTIGQQYMIYDLKYDYEPQEGVKMKLYFVSQDGNYVAPLLSTLSPVTVIITGSSLIFSLYAVKYGIEMRSGRRVMWVELVDDSFKLNNYYIALTGTACGDRIYNLGTSVDTRTSRLQLSQAIDPINQQIKNFTQFIDYEYTFNDFLGILKQKFNVGFIPNFDNSFKKSWVGTFREVLDSWCNFYSFAWFFENGQLKIVDPTKIILSFTTYFQAINFTPIDAIEFDYSESILDTYGKTVSRWYNQQGGQLNINAAHSNLIVTSTLFPVGQNINSVDQIINDITNSVEATLGDISNIVNSSTPSINSTQILLDPIQCAASLYGEKFWFLYNYYNGTANTECGWTPVALTDAQTAAQATVIQSLTTLGSQVAVFDGDYFNQKFQAYHQYASNIAGRYYLSDEIDNIDDNKTYQWYNVSNGGIFDFTSALADSLKINMQYALSQEGVQIIPGTFVNQYYDGIKYVGNIMWYKDSTFPINSQYVLDGVTSSIVDQLYEQLVHGTPASRSIDLTSLTQSQGLPKYIAYIDAINYPTVPSILDGYFSNLKTIANNLQPQFGTFNVIGTKQFDVNNLKITNALPSTISIVDGNQGPQIISNSSVLRIRKNGSYVVYYDKLAGCTSVATEGDYFEHRFDVKDISSDIPVPQGLTLNQNGSYTLNRDLTYINQETNVLLLQTLATARTFNTVELNFSLNYINLLTLPSTFLTNGLAGLSIEINDEGMKVDYKYSNKMLVTPKSEAFLEKLELQLKNSWIRSYNPIPVY